MSKPIEVLGELIARARAIRLPADFTIGAATAAYQIEGAVAEDGRGESIWDRFTHTPGTIADGQTGDVACDHYHRWREDIALMKQLNLNAYRFSIAWPRIMPEGRGKANEAGLAFYDRLVDGLLEAGIAPFVTLYHWDLPQHLQDEGGGWLRRGIVDDYLAFADVVTRRLGDRVKHWTTFNELWTFTWWGYAFGEDAPGLKLGAKGALAAGHHALLAHGKAVPLIRANVPGAKVGIVLDLNASTPASGRPEDIAATRRFDGCQNRWYLDALFRGAYPADMLEVYAGLTPDHPRRRHGGDRRADRLSGRQCLPPLRHRRWYRCAAGEFHPDQAAGRSTRRWAGRFIRPRSMTSWPMCRTIMRLATSTLLRTARRLTMTSPPDGAIVDMERARYMMAHLEQAARAIQAGMPLKGYFAWTLMDNFEWACGFGQRFGLIHVDYETQRRRVKLSGEIFAEVAGGVKQPLRQAV